MGGQETKTLAGNQQPLAVALGLAPAIREHAAEAERERRLPEELARDMARAGLHKLASPAYANGTERDPITQIKVIEAVSEADGSTGWNLMIGMEVQGFAAAAFPPECALQLFGDPEIIVSGALNPLGRAAIEDEGIRVNGIWPMASGCHNSDYFWGQCILIDDDGKFKRTEAGQVQLREVLALTSEVEILDTWKSSGICGSGSHDVKITDLFIPDDRVTKVTEQKPFANTSLFRIPTYSRLAYNKFAVASGIARAAIGHFKTLACEKKPRSTSALLCERTDAQRAIAEAETCLRSARAFVFESVSEVWVAVKEGRSVSPESRALLQLACSSGVQSACKAVDGMCAAAGVNVVYSDSLLGRCQRDIHVVPQHLTVSPQWTEAAGRVRLGLSSEVPIL